MDEGQIQLIKPFGPSIVKAKIPIKIVENLNNYIDEIVANEKKSLHLDHGRNLVGDVTQEFKLEKEMITKIGWLDFLGKCVYEWIKKDSGKKTQCHLLTVV